MPKKMSLGIDTQGDIPYLRTYLKASLVCTANAICNDVKYYDVGCEYIRIQRELWAGDLFVHMREKSICNVFI